MRSHSQRMSMNLVCLSGMVLLLAFNSPVFAQCSTSAWSGVTGTPQPLGPSTTPPGKKYEQSCGLTVDAAAAPSFVTTTSPSGEPSFNVRFYVLASDLSITSGDVTVLRARDGATTEVELRLRNTGGINYLVAIYRNNNALAEYPNPIPLEDVWTGVEVSWSAGAGDGTFGLKINDFPKYAKSDLVNGSAVINEVDLGVVNTASATGEVVLDAFDLRRTTSPGLLTVSEMFGISTRADVRTVHEIVIGGFIINGDTDKCVVVRGRALGPSEIPPGETALADPNIVLYDGGTPIGSNDDWQDSAEQAQIMAGLGLEPPLDSDAAIYACLAPGGYTAFLTGVGDSTGLGIVEVFDADEGTPYMWGISTRSVVDTANKVAIGGFIIDGDQPKQVVVRGRGPSVGVPDGVTRLSNPQITLYDGATPVASNDNWEDAANAGDIPPAYYDQIDALDSMIMTTLQPGAYTAIVSGVGGVTGVGIVEVFDVTGGNVAAQ
jgi:hypothetical protein